MEINVSKWKEFKLIDLFEMKAGKYYYSDEYNKGNTPYVSASDTNNGVQQYIDIQPLFPGNCLTIGKVGCTTFYQPFPFCATCDVTILLPLFDMNQNIGLFLATVINMEKNKWSYGRQIRLGDCKQLIISLPCDDNDDPDWKFMNDYVENIKSRERESKEAIENSINTKNTKKPPISSPTDWGKFQLQDIFYIKYGINLELLNCEEDKMGINFIARTSENNGVSARVRIIDGKVPQKEGLISVAGGGSVLSTFLQEKPFYSGRDLYTLEAKESIDKYAKLFIITLINREKFKYSYGRQANKTLPYIEIKLPINNDKKPNYEYMSNYMKSLPYADKI